MNLPFTLGLASILAFIVLVLVELHRLYQIAANLPGAC